MSSSKARGTKPPRTSSQGVGSRDFRRRAQRTRQEAARKNQRRARSFSRPQWSLRGTLRRVPLAAWMCAAVACLNAVAWSVITPPFQVPDEPEHIAYVKQLAETGRLPASKGNFSLEEGLALEGTRLQTVARKPQFKPIGTQAEERKLQADLQRGRRSSERGSEYVGVASTQPPLYYALEAVPYTLGRGGTLLDRIELMRLLSALMAGVTALFAFMFLREALSRVRWAWIVGGLGVALVPLLGFSSGAVNPDALLFAVTAGLLFALARGFRRGATQKLMIAIGAAIAIGFATKLNFVGLAPGALLGLVILGVRAVKAEGRRAYRWLAIALAIALAPPALYSISHLASGRPAFGIVSRGLGVSHGLWAEINYIWELYLPRLPGMHVDFAGIMPARQLWFHGYVGLYGWLDTTFPGWVYELALALAVPIGGLCLRSLIGSAGELRKRIGELAVYAVMCAGLLILIGADSYLQFPHTNAEYAQARYLLPLLPLLGAILALAARGAGRRWGPAVGAAIVMLFLAHDVFSQLQVVARYYG
ncbi:MAG TPA: DUF2142 domain-containing protein [Solirubrobacteraceae bacterium]|nr:DUF2142 domain-containing protein [Solirubrobacteraceae bacterium]